MCEKRIREFTAVKEHKSEEQQNASSQLAERKLDLEQKKGELDEIIGETKQEEEKLREKVKEIEAKIEPRLLTAFKRIRKNARNGLGFGHRGIIADAGDIGTSLPVRFRRFRLVSMVAQPWSEHDKQRKTEKEACHVREVGDGHHLLSRSVAVRLYG